MQPHSGTGSLSSHPVRSVSHTQTDGGVSVPQWGSVSQSACRSPNKTRDTARRGYRLTATDDYIVLEAASLCVVGMGAMKRSYHQSVLPRPRLPHSVRSHGMGTNFVSLSLSPLSLFKYPSLTSALHSGTLYGCAHRGRMAPMDDELTHGLHICL